MGDRYRYARPHSPALHNPARASLPLVLSPAPHEHHLHVVPASREVIPGPRSTTSTSSAGAVTTTTYKIKADPAPSRSSTARAPSRTRRSTLDSTSRPVIPTIVAAAPRHRERPVIVSADRPASPLRDAYRSSEENYYAIPASSQHDHHHHPKRYSAALDNADMHRLERERDGHRLRVAPREPTKYVNTRARPIYPNTVTRRADTVSDDYGEDGFGYTNPRDLVQYDLNNSHTPRRHSRRLSFEGGRMARPTSISGYSDVAPPSYDPRDRRPPPSMRGFDRIPGGRVTTWEQPRKGVAVPAPMAPIERPSRVDALYVPESRRSSSRRADRPVELSHDQDYRRPSRDEYIPRRDEYTNPRDDAVEERHRSRKHDPYDVPVDQWNVRSERSERPERYERSERSPPLHSEREGSDEDRSGHKHGRDILATGLSVAGAALGINVAKKTRDDEKDDRDDRDVRKRRDSDEEPRRRREARDERISVDLSGRNPKERRHRDDERYTPSPRAGPPRDRDSNRGSEEPPVVDLSGRDPKERPARKDRDADAERRRRSEAINSSIESHEDSSASDDAKRSRYEQRSRASSSAAQIKFNPNDTMDLKALKDALNSKDTSKEPVLVSSRSPRESISHSPKDALALSTDLRGRDNPPFPTDNRQLRVVSPPRDSRPEDKPVKGILRAPREKFPEDPLAIREGVAPLKDAKKDGVPADARWTKISRKLVNPEALEAGKERFEARDDFVIVLRVLSRDEVQTYAEVTQRIRAAREEVEEAEARDERRRKRRERHERHKRERNGKSERKSHSRRERQRDEGESEESDTTEESDDAKDRLVLEDGRVERDGARERTGGGPVMSGGLGSADGDRNEIGRGSRPEMSEKVNGA